VRKSERERERERERGRERDGKRVKNVMKHFFRFSLKEDDNDNETFLQNK
jgi:hypothetical protein